MLTQTRGHPVAMVFDILVAGPGNDVTVFLVALMTVFAALAGLMQVGRAWALALAQRGAMFRLPLRCFRRQIYGYPCGVGLRPVLWWRPDCRAARLPYALSRAETKK